MTSYINQIARLDELMIMGERESYLAELKRLIKVLVERRPEKIPTIDLEIAGPLGSDSSSFVRYLPLLQPAMEQAFLSKYSGDPDGAPAIHIRMIKEEFISIHQQAITRLQEELDHIR